MEVRKGYKQTDIGVIPENWDVKLLDDLAEKVMVGIASAATHAYRPQGIPLLRNQNIKKGYLQDDDLLYIHEEYEAIYKNKRLKTGDLLTARTGYPGTTCIIPPKYDGAQCFTTIITRLKKNEINSNYLCHYINSEYGLTFIEKSKIGGGQKNIGVGIFEAMPIPIPPTLAEQEAIAEALSNADALIESLETLLAKKRQVKQGAMSELLRGRRRLTGFSGEWEVKKIGDVTHSTAGGTPSTLIASYWGGDIRWMSSGELHLKKVYDVEGRITEEGLRNSSTKIIPPQCVLIGLAGQGKTRGTVAMNMVELCTNQSIAAIFPSESFIPEYLYFNLDNRYEELREISSGDGGRGGLNLTLINKLEILLPSIDEQTAIAEILGDIDAEIAVLEEKLVKARQVKAGMMSELLTGRVRLV